MQNTQPIYPTHSVTIQSDSHLSHILPKELQVNSIHHQAIKDLGQSLKVSALSPDGLIEATESLTDQHSIVTVQWHPELTYDRLASSLGLFQDLVARSQIG